MDITKYKTKLCNYYFSGYCKYGDNCYFAHGYDDLSQGKQLFIWDLVSLHFANIWAVADSIIEARKIILSRLKEFVISNKMPEQMCCNKEHSLTERELVNIINIITFKTPRITSNIYDSGLL